MCLLKQIITHKVLSTFIVYIQEAIDKGYISGNTVAIVRKNGKIFDYVLLHEEVREEEVVTVERVLDVLRKLS
ncbi:hypothetical protein SAG0324_06620 [Streptococcus agalactiae GB00300]|nr:hypothetical protein SAG0324_06620 [Streptococcus agalactiae GB00300]